MTSGWSMGGVIYICEGIGYGVDDNLNTFRVGTEQAILEGTDDAIKHRLERAGVFSAENDHTETSIHPRDLRGKVLGKGRTTRRVSRLDRRALRI